MQKWNPIRITAPSSESTRPVLPSAAGTYRLSDYGAAYVASVRANRPYVEHNAQRDSLSPEERERYAALQIRGVDCGPVV